MRKANGGRRTGGRVALVGLALAFGGCLTPGILSRTGSGSGAPNYVVPPAALSAASVEASSRVDTIGRQILAANPQIAAKPLFHAIGRSVDGKQPLPEIFHHPRGDIYISETLIRQCETDGQLAALLCTELGRMVSEREAVARLADSERLPPIDPGMANEVAGAHVSADQTRTAELALYEKERQRRRQLLASPPPDPQVLAQGYLTRAGYPASDLQAAAPLLKAAAVNHTFENQFTKPARAQ